MFWDEVSEPQPTYSTKQLENVGQQFAFIPLYSPNYSLWNEESSQGVMTFRKDLLSAKDLKEENLVVITAQGDAMEELIQPGSNLLVDTSKRKPTDGAVYVLLINGYLYPKYLQIQYDGSIRIINHNKKYPEQLVPQDQASTLEIIGRVEWCDYSL